MDLQRISHLMKRIGNVSKCIRNALQRIYNALKMHYNGKTLQRCFSQIGSQMHINNKRNSATYQNKNEKTIKFCAYDVMQKMPTKLLIE